MKFRTIILALLFASAAMPALAHPHIFARYRLTMMPGETGFIKLHFVFTFQGIANPILSPGATSADSPQLKDDMLANLAEHPFYIYLDMDGESVGQQMVRPMPIQNNNTKEKLYAFDLTVPDTVKNFGFALYDPTYFDSVWQADGNAISVKFDKIVCAVQEQDIGKTVWGILRAQYVQCADKNGPPSPPHPFKKLPMGELPDSTPTNDPSNFMGGRQIVP